jgi:hypothetical protein
MVISPKPRPIHSSGKDVKAGDVGFLNTDPSLRSDKATQFRLLYTLFKDSVSSTHLCRKCDDFKLYAMRILNKERVRIHSPHDHIQLQTEICQEIRELRSSFLSPFIWIYEDGPEIHSIAVCFAFILALKVPTVYTRSFILMAASRICSIAIRVLVKATSCT